MAVARGGNSSRYLPPGLHLVNPWRETLDVIPNGSFPISGIAALVTADGIPVRVPFSARVSLLPHDFEASMGALGGEHPRLHSGSLTPVRFAKELNRHGIGRSPFAYLFRRAIAAAVLDPNNPSAGPGEYPNAAKSF